MRFLFIVFLLSTATCQTASRFCDTPFIALTADQTTVQWKNCGLSPAIYHKQAKQDYFYQFLDLSEVGPTDNVIFSTTTALDAIRDQSPSNSTVYNIDFTNLFEDGKEVGKSVAFSVPGIFGTIFSLYNETVTVEYGGEMVVVQKGSLKIDTRLNNWRFQSTTDRLEVLLEIYSNKNMVSCNLTTLEGNKFVELYCEGERDDFKAVYPLFAVVDNHVIDLKFEIVNLTGIEGNLYDPNVYSLFDDNGNSFSSDENENIDCDGNKIGKIAKVTLKVIIPYFVGEFFFDPEIAVLLGGGGGSGSGCSSDGYDILRDPIYWLSFSFIVIAIILILIILGFASTSFGRRAIAGRGSVSSAMREVERRTRIHASAVNQNSNNSQDSAGPEM